MIQGFRRRLSRRLSRRPTGSDGPGGAPRTPQDGPPTADHGGPDAPVLRGRALALRPATDGDVPLLHAVLAAPEVARWWGDTDPGGLRQEIHRDDVHTFVIDVDGGVAGVLQYHEETEPDYRSAGMDIALSPEYHGRGLGTDALRTMAAFLLDGLGHHRLTIDPAADNVRAIATYRKIGFRPVGVMRRYERGRDGSWHDGLLMDMLREDLVTPSDDGPATGATTQAGIEG